MIESITQFAQFITANSFYMYYLIFVVAYWAFMFVMRIVTSTHVEYLKDRHLQGTLSYKLELALSYKKGFLHKMMVAMGLARIVCIIYTIIFIAVVLYDIIKLGS